MKHILLFIFTALISQNVFSLGTLSTGYVVPKGTSVRVSAHGVCKKVTNGHAVNHYFFSAKTSPEWSSFVGNTPSGVSLANCDATYRSCLDHLRANPGATDGKYSIDPDGDGTGVAPLDVYCDMTTDGGGWTLVWSNTRGGTNKPVTSLSWASATLGGPVCSEANGSGTGCGPYLGNDKEDFNFFIGVEWWQKFSNSQKNSEMMYLWSTDYGEPIAQGGKFTVERLNSSSLYKLKTSNFVQLVGTEVADMHDYHGAVQMLFSTFDLKNDTHEGIDCSKYSQAPFWYRDCWSGSISGGGELSSDGYYNGAYYLDSEMHWGTSNGQGAGNGWLYVREYDYLSNCSEIKSKVPQAPSGLYWIDPDGSGGSSPILANCDMNTDGGGWTLVMNQKADTGGFFASEAEANNFNTNDPVADRYSVLSRMEGFRSIKGNFTFRLKAVEQNIRNIWSQKTNPVVNQAVQGYVPISIQASSDFWGGLERNCGVSCVSSFIDGSVGIGDWWYAVASYANYVGADGGNGIPFSTSAQGGLNRGVNHTQLWVRDDSFLLGEPRDCQDVLEYGLSTGNGLYWVDPTQSGTSQQVYCDMTSDGGGWTLVFNQNMLGGFFANAADAISKNPGTPTANHYSILDRLDDFKANNRYIFKMNWPGFIQRNIWAQSTNPAVDQPVAGYVPLSIDVTSNYWAGLERNCGINCAESFIDGSINHVNWFYAIGSYVDWNVGIPAATDVTGSGAPHAQLWTRRAEGNFTKRSCKEILANGLSTGDGLYVIDPDGVGGEPPVRVYCDMTTNGGGWTRVAFNNGAANATTLPDDFLVNKYRRDLIGIPTIVNNAASLNSEWFSRLVGTTDAMMKSPSHQAAPIIENGFGEWHYDSPKCGGTLLHTGRSAGCPGQSANDQHTSYDMNNIAWDGGASAIVPHYNNTGFELCYPGRGSCSFEFYLR